MSVVELHEKFQSEPNVDEVGLPIDHLRKCRLRASKKTHREPLVSVVHERSCMRCILKLLLVLLPGEGPMGGTEDITMIVLGDQSWGVCIIQQNVTDEPKVLTNVLKRVG